MTIQTKSKFYYGYVVDAESTYLNFDEGGLELTAQLNPGSYSMTGMANEVSRALNATGLLEYTVNVDRTTRVFTISSDSIFNLLSLTGSNVGLSGWELFGFDVTSDKTGAITYTGENAGGSEFKPQFLLQKYVPFEDWQGFASSNVNESGSGVTEIYSLGSRLFSEFNIAFQNNGLAGGAKNSPIDYNANGVNELREFMKFAITKGPIEFMPDRDNVFVFDEMILEKTSSGSNGTEFKLKELIGKNLVGYFDSGKLKFRKQ